MSESSFVFGIDEPHFTVELCENLLKIDLKENVKNEIRKGVQAKSALGQVLGRILNMFAPLHVRLSDIGSVEADDAGNVTIALPHQRDVTISLDPKGAVKLVDKLSQLVPLEKEKELGRIMKRHRLRRIEEEERTLTEEGLLVSGPARMPIPEPRGVRRLEEAEKEIEVHET